MRGDDVISCQRMSTVESFRTLLIVRPSGSGRTKDWLKTNEGTVSRVSKTSVFVRWHGTCFEEEMGPEELISTGKANSDIPHSICDVVTLFRRVAA